ncbi:MAG: hypothetical protein ACTSXA_10185 [Candidatus Heimdallarchaeota archaeon]
MAITDHDFKRYSNPEFSLLDQEYRKIRNQYLFWTVVLSICLFLSGLAILIPFIMAKQSYEYITMLKERERVDKLLEFAKLRSGEYNNRFAIYALVDMKVKDIAFLLDDLLEEANVFMFINLRNKYQLAFEVLAAKLDYDSVGKMLQLLEKPTQRYHIVPSIPITSVYYLDDEPLKAKCMISSLLLDFDEDLVIACPNCGNLAKKELLTEWLEENGTCKACDRKISMADCPIVKIKE